MSKRKKRLSKSYIVPFQWRFTKVEGQVPSRNRMRTLGQMQALSRLGARSSEGADNLSLGRLAGIPENASVPTGDKVFTALVSNPGGMTEDRLMDSNSPVFRASDVSANMGMDLSDEMMWSSFMHKAVNNSSNEIVFRKTVMDKLIGARMDQSARRELFRKALSYWRTIKKSEARTINVVTPSGEMKKALYIGPRGGRWADPQHTIPYDPQKHGPGAGKKVVVIDKTAAKPKLPVAKQPVKPKTATEVLGEEKSSGGTAESRKIDPKSKQIGLFTIPADKVDVEPEPDIDITQKPLEEQEPGWERMPEVEPTPEKPKLVIKDKKPKVYPGTTIPLRVDLSKWEPGKDQNGKEIKLGDRVSQSTYPKGTVRGTVELSKRSWTTNPDGTEVGALELVSDEGKRYLLTSKVTSLESTKPVVSNEVKMAGSVLEYLQENAEGDLASELDAIVWGRTVEAELSDSAFEQLKSVLTDGISDAVKQLKSKKADVRADGRKLLANLSRVMMQVDPTFEQPDPKKRKSKPKIVVPKEERKKVKAKKPEKRKRKSKKKKSEIAIELGEHVWGSRKDMWDLRSVEDIEKLHPADQAKAVTKARLLPQWEPGDALALGKTSEAIIFRKAIESCLATKAPDDLSSRQDYMQGVDFLARSLDGCYTQGDVEDFLTEWKQLASGKQKVVTFTEDERGTWYDEWYKEVHGREPEWDWKKRREVWKEVKSLWERSRKAHAQGDYVTSKKLDKEAWSLDSELDAKGQTGERLNMPEVIGWKFNKGKHGVVISSTQDNTYTAYATDTDALERENNPYYRRIKAMGPRMLALVLERKEGKYGSMVYTKQPTVYRRAVSTAYSWRKKSDSEKVDAMFDYLAVKQRERKVRTRYAWEIKGGEINRVGGRDVPKANIKKFEEDFNFHNVQWGQWMKSDPEAAVSHLKGAHGALFDLADIMGMDPKFVSMRQRLSMAFGARGVGKFAAHYEIGGKIINITKIAGGGSLAHEWGHAMDNIISEAGDPESTSAERFMSQGRIKGLPDEVKDSVHVVMQCIYQSDMYKHAKALSPGSDGYYARPREMFARAFESYIEDELVSKKRKSSYLVSGTRDFYPTGEFKIKKQYGSGHEVIQDPQPYPQGEDRKMINEAMRDLLKAIVNTNMLEKALRYLMDLKKANRKFAIHTAEELKKAKYLSRKRVGDRWVYEYPKDKKPSKAKQPNMDPGIKKALADIEGVLPIGYEKYSRKLVMDMIYDATSSLPRASQLVYGVAWADTSGRLTTNATKAIKAMGGKEIAVLMAEMVAKGLRVAGEVPAYLNQKWPDYIEKAMARGGTYHRRVPVQKAGSKTKYRYYYKPDDYDKRKDAHPDGDSTGRAYLTNKIAKCVGTAGEKGCGPDAMADLVKKFGSKRVAEVLRDSVKGGTLAFKKGRFTLTKQGANSDEADTKRGI